LKKRKCERFLIPGTTLYYGKKAGKFFSFRQKYSEDYYPVINISRGGAKFLCNERLRAGIELMVKLNIPGIQETPEIIASVRWISKNPEQSYKYQTGIAFNSYGTGKNENPLSLLAFMKDMEELGAIENQNKKSQIR